MLMSRALRAKNMDFGGIVRFQYDHKGSLDYNILSISSIHGLSPAECLSIPAGAASLRISTSESDFVYFVSVCIAAGFCPNLLKHLKARDIVVEATLFLDLNAAFANDISVSLFNAFCSDYEQRPEEELIDTAVDCERSDMIQRFGNESLE